MNPQASTPAQSFPTIAGYTILEQLYGGTRTAVYRAMQTAPQRPVVIKVLRREYPSLGELVQFRNQYTIAKNLPSGGIVQPLSLEPLDSGYALVMEDFGGLALSHYIQQQSLDWVDVLAIALQLADILQTLSQHQVVHKDIKPANILIHPASKQVKLIDFSIASLLSKETQDIQNPNVLEGTLAYLAPEQTGRMNRGIDYRADFYALGVTLYQLLSGSLPFTSDDPLELVHSHIAKLPVPVDQINGDIPAIVAAIVSKLMAKNAEDRYQSAIGLRHDLQQCLTQWQETRQISAFELGQRDLSDRFLIPEKLYGRAAEVQTLLDAFDRVVQGRSELMLVAGCSGIGKTAIVNEVHKPITRQSGYFIKGKFDQFNRDIPLSAFVQAFRDLMGQLLSESDAQLQTWKTQILDALGDHGQIMIEVIPELERIIGSQPPATELSGTAAQNRFNLLFQKFIQVFTTPEHPLVMFLDDLQWADSASLNLVQVLMAESMAGHLLLIGADRDNEVFAAHPLMLTLDTLRQAGTTVDTIALQPLSQTSLNQLIADTLHCAEPLAQPLTELVRQKTQGNPFFAAQFLKTLYQEQLITFDRAAGCWQCDIVRVRNAALTDDVVEFMALQLQKLPEATQTVLQLAACIGVQFDLQTLAIVSEQPPTAVAVHLWPALQAGLVLPQNDTYKLYLDDVSVERSNLSQNLIYKFLHDRIQQAAYTLIPEDRRAEIHYRLGRLLVVHLPSASQEERIFEIVGHLNHCSGLIVGYGERIELAQLNLMAGCKAMNATAYGAALTYFNQGIDLLPEDAWTHHYGLTLALHHHRLDVAYLSSQFEELEAWGEVVLQKATAVLDRIKVYETRIMALQSQGRFLEVLEMGLQVLRSLGIEFPAQPTSADIGAAYARSQQVWQGRDPLSLVDLPAMEDPQLLAAMQIMTKLVPSAYIAAPSLLPLLSFKQVELSVQHGNAPTSIFSYADYGLILCGIIDDIPTGYEFGQLSLALLEKLQVSPFKSRTYFIVNAFIRHWQEPLHRVIPSLLAGYRSGLEGGDWECVALNLLACSHYQYWAGKALKDLAEDMGAYRHVIQQVKQTPPLKSLEAYLQTVLNLLGQADVPFHLRGTVFNDHQSLPSLKANNDRAGLFHVYLNQAALSYLFEQDQQAAQVSSLLDEYSDGACGFFLMPVGIFYDALIQLRGYPSALLEEQTLILERVASHQAKLQNWATYAPCNHQHRWQLVAAETHRVLDQRAAAIDLYDLAIASAKTSGFIQDEALANELAAKFYLDWGKEKVAAGYMQEAYYGYAKWGAKAKTDDLEKRYPQLLQPILYAAAQPLNVFETLASIAAPNLPIQGSTEPSRSSSTSVNTVLDLAAILKASQSLASTIRLDELLHQFTQIILQNSGGDRCALILPDPDGKYAVVALATPTTCELCAEPLEGNRQLPVELIRYVKNTQEAVILDEGRTELPISSQYLSQHYPNSILCLPILNKAQLTGILYVENRATRGVFTSDRVVILNFLCTQAAISLENARLYALEQQKSREIAQKEAEYRSIFESVNDGLFVYDLATGKIVAVNPTMCQMYGYSEEEWIALSLVDFVDSQSLHLFDDFLKSLSLNQEFYTEALARRKDGSSFEIEVKAVPFIYKQRPHGLTVVRDISERKTAELALREFQERLTFLIQQTPIGIIEWNTEFKVVRWNPSAEHIFGYRADEMMGHHAVQIVPESDRQHVAEVMTALIKQSGGFHSLNKNVRQDGTLITCEWINTPLRDAEGNSVGIFSMVQDVSDRLAAETAIKQKSQALEQALRNLQQAQLQVVQSEKMASLGNLVAGVAHEINNPIGFLNGSIHNSKDYVQDLLRHLALYQQHYPDPVAPIQDDAEEIDLDFLSEDLPKLLDSMKGATDRIKRISTSLRTFSRADTEYKVSANLHEGLDSTLLILKYRLKANEHRPEIQVLQQYGDLPSIQCFPGQLNQVFMNILANAIDMFDEIAQQSTFADLQANPQIINIQTAITEQSMVEIRIRDNGKGMSEEIKSRIFDHLFTTKGVGKGTGLGLAIARQIVVESHGG
ncbi:MAG: PAS domain S-box protein, partial [Leptolyngbya sp.]|nr:PAS domain S-box protein [Leptolyngbya sp.]